MNRILLSVLATCLACTTAAAQAPAKPPTQPGPAEKLGGTIDRGLRQIGSELSEAWTEVRKSVEKMGIQGRVYGRLHWDKALDGASLDISVRDSQIVVLSGTVASATAKLRAEQLAQETIGVNSVVNDLTVAAPK
jgi:hyperosmotically inducible protein